MSLGGLGGALGGGLVANDNEDRQIAMSIGENVTFSTDSTSETNDGRSREDQVKLTLVILPEIANII